LGRHVAERIEQCEVRVLLSADPLADAQDSANQADAQYTTELTTLTASAAALQTTYQGLIGQAQASWQSTFDSQQATFDSTVAGLTTTHQNTVDQAQQAFQTTTAGLDSTFQSSADAADLAHTTAVAGVNSAFQTQSAGAQAQFDADKATQQQQRDAANQTATSANDLAQANARTAFETTYSGANAVLSNTLQQANDGYLTAEQSQWDAYQQQASNADAAYATALSAAAAQRDSILANYPNVIYDPSLIADDPTFLAAEAAAEATFSTAQTGFQNAEDTLWASANSGFDAAVAAAEQAYLATMSGADVVHQSAEQADNDAYNSAIQSARNTYDGIEAGAEATYNNTSAGIQSAFDTAGQSDYASYQADVQTASNTYDSSVQGDVDTYNTTSAGAAASYNSSAASRADSYRTELQGYYDTYVSQVITIANTRNNTIADAMDSYNASMQGINQTLSTSDNSATQTFQQQQDLALQTYTQDQTSIWNMSNAPDMANDPQAFADWYNNAMQQDDAAKQQFFVAVAQANVGYAQSVGDANSQFANDAQNAAITLANTIAEANDTAEEAQAAKYKTLDENFISAADGYQKDMADLEQTYGGVLDGANLQLLNQSRADQRTYEHAVAAANEQFDEHLAQDAHTRDDALIDAAQAYSTTEQGAAKTFYLAAATAEEQLQNALIVEDTDWNQTEAAAMVTYTQAVTDAGVTLEAAHSAAEVSYDAQVTAAALQMTTTISQARAAAFTNSYGNDPDAAAVATAWADYEIAGTSAWATAENAKMSAYAAYTDAEVLSSQTLEVSAATARQSNTNQLLGTAVTWVNASALANHDFDTAAINAYDAQSTAELSSAVTMLHSRTGAVQSALDSLAPLDQAQMDSYIDAAYQQDLGWNQAEFDLSSNLATSGLQFIKDQITASTSFLTPLASADEQQTDAEASTWKAFVTGFTQATLPMANAAAAQAAAQGVLFAQQNVDFLANQTADFFANWYPSTQSPGGIAMTGGPVVQQAFFDVPPEQVRQPVTHNSALDIPFLQPGQHSTELKLADAYTDVEFPIYTGYNSPNVAAIRKDGLVNPTAAELARYNIRTNIDAYKQQLVDQLYGMLKENPPVRTTAEEGSVSIKLTDTQRIDAANKLADIYIQAVYDFLASHWGAQPMQGQRNFWLDAAGIQTPQNHPWCADWAGYLNDRLVDKVDVNLQKIFTFKFAQQHTERTAGQFQVGPNQHNFIVVYVVGHAPSLPYNGNSPLGGALIFDPWPSLTPLAFSPDVSGSSGRPIYWITNWMQPVNMGH
jgi:hypothetical protein